MTRTVKIDGTTECMSHAWHHKIDNFNWNEPYSCKILFRLFLAQLVRPD